MGRGSVALPTAPLRQAAFGIDIARLMNSQHDLAGFFVNVGNHLPDYGSDNAFLEPGIHRGCGSQVLQTVGQAGEGGGRDRSRRVVVASCSAIFASVSASPASAAFQRDSGSDATRRLAGSVA